MDGFEKPKRKHLNVARRHALKAARVQLFAQEYARKAQKGFEPNDRRYSRKTEKIVQRLKPEELDRMLRDDEP